MVVIPTESNQNDRPTIFGDSLAALPSVRPTDPQLTRSLLRIQGELDSKNKALFFFTPGAYSIVLIFANFRPGAYSVVLIYISAEPVPGVLISGI